LLEAACIGCKSPQQNHRKTGGTTWMHSERLLVYITMVTMENHHFHGKIHYKWWLSIVIGILYLAWCPWKNTSTKESAANLPEPGDSSPPQARGRSWPWGQRGLPCICPGIRRDTSIRPTRGAGAEWRMSWRQDTCGYQTLRIIWCDMHRSILYRECYIFLCSEPYKQLGLQKP
jgi:hypothetical protein